jgi:hypothetical protein
VSRHARTLERDFSIPTVGVAGANIVGYATGYDFLYTNGMPIRYIALPFPVAGQPKAVHHQYIFDGKDQVSGKPTMQALVDALTKPLTDKEKIKGAPPEATPEPRLLPPDTEDNLQRLFKDKDWTDYYPIILPTEERVAQMLAATSHKPDEVVKTITWPGGARPLTVEKAAVCAVMAGAKPAYFPVILAIATTVPFGNSTTPMANMMVVNGPIRKLIGMNSGGHALGPYNEANSILGRTLTLMSKTAGNLHARVTAWSSQGNTIQYNNLCFAENEEELPAGWDPLHVQNGFKPTDNVLTTGTGWSCISSVGSVQQTYPPQMLMRDYMRSLSGNGSGATILMDPTVAALLKDAHGFKTKAAVAEWLSQNIEKTAASYWGNAVVASMAEPLAIQGLEPYASWRKLPADGLLKPFINPKGISIVLVGGKTQSTWFATDFRLGRGVLIDSWK